jgi:hypothetical protein
MLTREQLPSCWRCVWQAILQPRAVLLLALTQYMQHSRAVCGMLHTLCLMTLCKQQARPEGDGVEHQQAHDAANPTCRQWQQTGGISLSRGG